MQGVYIFFLFLLQNMDCGYSLEPPRWGGSKEDLQSLVLAQKWKKYQKFSDEIFNFYSWKKSVYCMGKVS